MEGYREIPSDELDGNVIEMIGSQWLLITAGDGGKCNTMTASWGGIGFVWGKPAVTLYIRPQRYTREFVDSSDRLTVSFLGGEYRPALAYCGSHSGRDEDKIANAGLTVGDTDGGVPFIAQAEIVLQCRKMYRGRMRKEDFLEPELVTQWYPEEDFHYVYICEIEKTYVKTR